MPPRLQLQPKRVLLPRRSPYICNQCRLASLATATTPAPPIEQSITVTGASPIARYSKTQPPSYKPPEFRKSQLHRQYQSLLRSSPLIVIFQHNNLKATEWMAVRRELATALRKVDDEMIKNGHENTTVGSETKIIGVQTGIFASALRVVEFWDPKFEATLPVDVVKATDPQTASSTPITSPSAPDPSLIHGLSKKAWKYSKKSSLTQTHGLEPLLSGPLALLTLPTVSPQHLRAAISILSPSAPNFPAPRRKVNPGYHEPAVQNGVAKLLMLAARVEGKVFDMDGTKWIGGIQGGMEGLRAQLVGILQGIGAGVTGALEAQGRSLWATVEGRRGMLEEEEKEKGKSEGESS